MSVGIVYLLHLERPYWHARHYLGWAADPLKRLAQHAAGRGSPLLAAALAEGIGWRVAALWKGSRFLERRLKRWHGAGAFCPICRRERAMAESRKPSPVVPLWAPPPAVPPQPNRQPLNVDEGGVEVIILSDRVEGVYTHFVKGRTRFCGRGQDEAGKPVPCWLPECRSGQTEARWQGWLAVCPKPLSERRLLCITPAVIADCPMLATAANLRGMRLRVWRTHPGPAAKMRGRIWRPDVEDARLPAAFDVRRVVEKMIGAESRFPCTAETGGGLDTREQPDPLTEGL